MKMEASNNIKMPQCMMKIHIMQLLKNNKIIIKADAKASVFFCIKIKKNVIKFSK